MRNHEPTLPFSLTNKRLGHANGNVPPDRRGTVAPEHSPRA
jgi:hypothetical protein